MNSCEAYKVLMNVQRKRGNEKLSYLEKYPQVKPILQLALDPYTTFGVTDPKVPGTGSNNFKTAGIKQLLDDLASRRLTGNRALDMVFHAQSCMTKESAALLGLILDKNPRIGVAAKSVNKIWPGLIPVHEVMLCKTFDPSKVIFPCVVEPKIDGIRGTVVDGPLFTRKGLKIYGLEVIERELELLPPYEWDGELTIPGHTFQKASGRLRSDEATPDAVFTIFGARNTQSYYDFLQHSPEARDYEHIKFAPHTWCHSLEDIYKAYQSFRDEGYEGAVIKNPQYKYCGARTWDWMKLKPLEDGEFVVTGMYEGEGKYAGMLGGITVDFHGLSNDVGSGFSDEQRSKFWVEDNIVGKLAHIEYMEKTDDGNMRHSRFKDIRWDK